MKKVWTTALAVAALAAPVFAAEVFDVDPAHSSIEFAVKHMLVSTVKGKFADIKAEFSLDPADPTTLQATCTIKAESITTGQPKRDAHLRGADFFETEKYPEIKFVATGVKRDGDDYILTGNLTMRDVTKEISIPVSFSGPVQDPWGETRFGFEGSTKINRKDWHINYSAVLDNGGLVASDEVKIEISIEGVKRK